MPERRSYINCHELIEFLHLYLAGELPQDRRVEFERHLRVCPDCMNYIRQYEETIRLAKIASADPREAVPDPPEELVAAILAARRKGG